MYESMIQGNKESDHNNKQKATTENTGVQKKRKSKAGNVRYVVKADAVKREQKGEIPVVQRVLRPIRQNGSNCGLFAVAMVLEDLTGEKGEMIAAQMEELGREKGYTSIGEMFNAENLLKTGQEYCERYFPEAGIHFQMLNFETRTGMEEIFNLAKEKEKYVLFPYFSEHSIPFTGYGVVPKEQMDSAHWAVIERRVKEGEVESRLHMLEGHLKVFDGPENSYLNAERMDKLFAANMSLNNEIVWGNFWNRQSLAILRMKEQLKHAGKVIEKIEKQGEQAEKRLSDMETPDKEIELKKLGIEWNEREWKKYLDEFEKREWEFKEKERLLICGEMHNHMLESPYYEAYLEQLEDSGPIYEAYIQQMTESKHYYEECKRELELIRQDCQEYKKKVDRLQKKIEKQKEELDRRIVQKEAQRMEQFEWRNKIIKYHQDLTDEKNRIEELLEKTITNRARFFNSPRIRNKHPDILEYGDGYNVKERVDLRNRIILIEKKQ